MIARAFLVPVAAVTIFAGLSVTPLAKIAEAGPPAAAPADVPDQSAKVAASPPARSGAEDENELSRQATDPTAPLMAFSLLGTYTANFHGPDVPGQPDDRWEATFRPVIPFTAFGVSVFAARGPGCPVADPRSCLILLRR